MDYAFDLKNEEIMNILLEEFSNRIFNQYENVNSIIGSLGEVENLLTDNIVIACLTFSIALHCIIQPIWGV